MLLDACLRSLIRTITIRSQITGECCLGLPRLYFGYSTSTWSFSNPSFETHSGFLAVDLLQAGSCSYWDPDACELFSRSHSRCQNCSSPLLISRELVLQEAYQEQCQKGDHLITQCCGQGICLVIMSWNISNPCVSYS